MEAVILAGRLGLAVALLVAGAAKLRGPAEFARAIRGYRLLPERWARPLAVSLPWLELACGSALAVGLASRAAAAVVAGLLAVFTGAVVASLVRGLRVDCGCFGAARATPAGGWTIARNAVLIGAAILVVARPPAALAWWPAPPGPGLSHTDGLAVLITTTALLLTGSVLRHAIESTR